MPPDSQTPRTGSNGEPDDGEIIVLRLCGYCGQVWRLGYTARCGANARCNAGRGGPCQVSGYCVVAWEEFDDA